MLQKSFNQQLNNQLTSFIDKQQNIWFLGKDVAGILGYKDTNQAIRKHVSPENKIIQFIQQKNTRGKHCLFINETGFYELMIRDKNI